MSLPRIVRRSDGLILASAEKPEHVLALEGNWYFHPDSIDRDILKTSERQYICPYKGTCWWVDAHIGNSFVADVAWVYPDPRPGFRRIAGWYGFYPEKNGFAKVDGG